jgi:hypothetical protein
MLSSSSMDEPQSLSVEHAECLTAWFQYLTTTCEIISILFLRFDKYQFLDLKIPSLTSCSHLLTNQMLLMDIIHNFTLWLNEQKSFAYKHELLHGMVFRCNQERTLYLPVPFLDQMVGNSFEIKNEKRKIEIPSFDISLTSF